jgi:glucan biosynthesis protein C
MTTTPLVTAPTAALGRDAAETRQRDVSIDYLRATVTLMVLAHHSMLAYTTFARFDAASYLASTAPIVDHARWGFFDYAENFNDVFFMSLMFFVSGLFVGPAIRRRSAGGFLRERTIRLGLPFLVCVACVMPIAYYASWRFAGHDTPYLAYWWQNITRDGWPPGPEWFIWMLLAFDALAAAWYLAGGRTRPRQIRPVTAFIALFIASAVAYLPLLAIFGFGRWIPLIVPPLWFQVSRVLLYLVWFTAGVWLGSDWVRSLARGWPWWAAGCIVAYNVLVFTPDNGVLHALLWVLSLTASCFGLTAVFAGVVHRRHAWMDSLARCAYIMYLIHYVFVTWTQYALVGLPLPAPVKFAATFASVVALSWVSARAILVVPTAATVLYRALQGRTPCR